MKNVQLNEITLSAIKEGERIALDPDVKGYLDIDEFKEALESDEEE